MEAKNILQGILLNKLPRIFEEIRNFMVTAARMIYATKWKPIICPSLEERETKLSDYAAMVKLTTFLRNRLISQYEER